jgi:hypothetical protein
MSAMPGHSSLTAAEAGQPPVPQGALSWMNRAEWPLVAAYASAVSAASRPIAG